MRSAIFRTLVMLAWAAGGPAGCELFDPSGGHGTDAGVHDDSPWQLTDPTVRTYEPGEMVTLRVAGIRPGELPTYLWVGEAGDVVVPIAAAGVVHDSPPEMDAGVPLLDEDSGTYPTAPDAGPDDEPRTYVFMTPLPIWRAGHYRIAVGTADAAKTHFLDIDVQTPMRRMPREMAAALVQSGVHRYIDDARAVLDDTDADWQNALSNAPPESRANIDANLALAGQLADQLSSDWMAMSEEDELSMQSFFFHAGLFESFSAMDTTSTTALTIPGLDRYLTRPLHGALFSLDALSAFLGLVGMVVDVIEVTTAVAGIAPASLLAVGVKLAIAITKFTIDTLIPTDLNLIEGQGQRYLVNDQGGKWVYWGRFSPQNSVIGTGRSLEDFALIFLGELLPGGNVSSWSTLRTFLQSVFAMLAARIPGAAVSSIDDGSHRWNGLYTILDMDIYRLELSDIIALMPMTGPVLAAIARLVFDPDLRPPVAIGAVNPTWAAGASLSMNYRDSVLSADVPFPMAMPYERASMIVTASAFSFGSMATRVIFQTPTYDTVEFAHRITYVESMRDTRIYDTGADRAWMIAKVYPDGTTPGSGADWYIDETTTDTRDYAVELWNTGPLTGPSERDTVTLLVNGEPQITTELSESGPVPYTLHLAPGLNEIVVQATVAQGWTCLSELAPGTSFCLRLHLPDAVNADTTRSIYMAQGQEFTFQIWTPPHYER